MCLNFLETLKRYIRFEILKFIFFCFRPLDKFSFDYLANKASVIFWAWALQNDRDCCEQITKGLQSSRTLTSKCCFFYFFFCYLLFCYYVLVYEFYACSYLLIDECYCLTFWFSITFFCRLRKSEFKSWIF